MIASIYNLSYFHMEKGHAILHLNRLINTSLYCVLPKDEKDYITKESEKFARVDKILFIKLEKCVLIHYKNIKRSQLPISKNKVSD